ncbi:MAG: cation:proton antiporter [Oligoflexales bacterium]
MQFPALIQDLAIILGVAAIVTFIFRRIKQPVVLGYIVAGIIVGPYTPSVFSVKDLPSVKVWAELGVIFLMFSLGLEFSFRRLGRVGISAGFSAIFQIVAMLIGGFTIAKALGWSRMDAVFLGCMISISSTTIIIKALEELGLKSKRFADLVFGILIVEDLAAILMLVALTDIVTTSEIGGVKLLMAGGKLAIVVGVWFLVGMFVVPRFVRSVGRHGNDEMLIVVATGLCLALVGLAEHFHYSVALGAFIMGSILAESSEAKRIEHLVQPVKDIFGAIFFVSVGMLLDPKAITENVASVILISAIIIVGKLLSVTLGAFITGQTIRNSVQTGFSMAQIGEFSFIIASLGRTYEVISESLYPIIVASSLITTFTTPYLLKISGRVAATIEAGLPPPVKIALENYVAWVERRSVSNQYRKTLSRALIKWCLNAVVVITLFTVGADRLIPLAEQYIENSYTALGAAWLVAFFFSAPSIWAMLSVFRALIPSEPDDNRPLPGGGALLLSRVITIGLVGSLSVAYFPAFATFVVTVGVCTLVFIIFRRQVETYYHWIEQQFQSGFRGDLANNMVDGEVLDRLAPWDAHLVEVKVPSRSFLVGRALADLKLREKYGLNVVVIVRDEENIVAPKANERLYPSDCLLCFGTDAEIERFRRDLEVTHEKASLSADLDEYDIQRLKVRRNSSLQGISIRESDIREKFDCIVVGLERSGQRIRSPESGITLAYDDVLWVVGERENLKRLGPIFG